MFWRKREPVEPDPNELVTLASFSIHNQVEAELLKGDLDRAGIHSVVLNENTMQMYAGAPFAGMVRLKVRHRDVEKARRILGA